MPAASVKPLPLKANLAKFQNGRIMLHETRYDHHLRASASVFLPRWSLPRHPALAGEDCECVGNGKKIKEGGVVCLQIGSSTRYLARCERNLNNTSWKKIADGCPTASMS
jgi:hypothetical protein